MMAAMRAMGRGSAWVLHSRAMRVFVVLALLVWGFDAFVTAFCDAAWFSSVGFGSLWRARLAGQIGVFAGWLLFCFLLSVGVMRVVARPASVEESEPVLPRALQSLAPLRAHATRWGWAILALAAIAIGLDLSQRGSDFARGFSPSSGRAAAADFWLERAPALGALLDAGWKFSLVLSLVALGAGALRALPFLAARPSNAPRRWTQMLARLGAALLALRALGFAFEGARHFFVADENGFARVAFALLGLAGALGCVACAWSLRRPRARLGLFVGATLVLPYLLGDLLAPFRGSSAPPLSTARNFEPIENVPVWDEATLLRASRNASGNDRLTEWKTAGISSVPFGLRGDVVGVHVVSDGWAGHGLADASSELVWRSLDLPQSSPSRQGQPLGPMFYGLSGRALLDDVPRFGRGVAFDSWPKKWAWAWRLRDPLLLFEGARSQRLLVERGAREVGEKLAPDLAWDEAVPRRDAQTGSAFWESVGYRTAALFPQRPPFEDGLFAGQNFVLPVAVLRMEALSGAVRVAPFRGGESLSFPALFQGQKPQIAPTPALEVARAKRTALAWTREDGVLARRALPLELRERVTQKEDELGAKARTESNQTLVGATPSVWQIGGKVFVARPFFDSSAKFVGLASGAIGERGARWVSASGAESPSKTSLRPALPGVGSPPVSLGDLAQQALESGRAASAALRAGRYVESQKHSARAETLLEELERRTR